MKDLIHRWTARHGISPERRAREEPLRAELLRRILIASFIALVVQAALSLYHSNNLWWFFWGTIEPSVLLLIAAVTRKRQPSLASILVVVALSHLAAFTDVRFGLPYLGDALLALTIIVCGLLIGEYFVLTWTVICCAIAIWLGVLPNAGDWRIISFWCGFYIATAWLVTLFSRHLERLFEASRAAEEQQRGAIVAERTRFAREIHDSLAQGFTGIVIQLNAAEQRLRPDPEQALPHLEQARQLARHSLQEARRSVNALRPGLLANGDLLSAMEQIGSQLTAGSGIHFETHLEGQPYALSEETEAHLLRIGQEAMTNAVRHARPKQIDVHLKYDAAAVALEVRDDGCGMEHSGDGFGLKNMAERAGQLGGELRIVTQPGGGTKIMTMVPGR